MNSPQQGAPPNSSFSAQNAMQHAHPVAMLPDANGIACQTAHTRDGSESLNHSLSFFDVAAQQHPQQQLVQYVVQQPMPISASPQPFSNTDSPQHFLVLPSAMPQQRSPQQYNVPHGAPPIPMQPMFFVPTSQQQQLLPVQQQPGSALPPVPGANQPPQFIFLSQPMTTNQYQQQQQQQQQPQQQPPPVSGGYVLKSPQSAAPPEHPSLDRPPPTDNVATNTPVALPPFPTAKTEASSHKQPCSTANVNSQSQTNASSPQNQARAKPDSDDDDEAPSPLATKYIFNCLDKRINAEFLSTALKPYNAERVHVVGERTGKIRGFAYVDFATPDDALRCHREMNNTKLLDRYIKIHVSKHDPSFGKE